jgi:sugar transferase (PEP-CTERM/EpsH1 system associated)
MSVDSRPLVAHVMHRFDVGGLESGAFNLTSQLRRDRFGHAVIGHANFRRRMQQDDVQFAAVKKPPGQGLRLAPRMFGILREFQPAIVRARNLAALEKMLPAVLVCVSVLVHGGDGWGNRDPEGRSREFQLARRAYRTSVHHYLALSGHLVGHIGIAKGRIAQVCNGCDTKQLHPAGAARSSTAGSPFLRPELWLVGTVGRLQSIKDQVPLARAFVRAFELASVARARLRLVMTGDGSLRSLVEQGPHQGGVEHLAWLTGERGDVPEFLRGLDSFVLPSRAEGVFDAILEATAPPITATSVGGSIELLADRVAGWLVPGTTVGTMVISAAGGRRRACRGHGVRAVCPRRGTAGRQFGRRSGSVCRSLRSLTQTAVRRAPVHQFT